MRIRRFLIVLGILVIPTTALADDHRADLFGGYSRGEASSLNGFNASALWTVPQGNRNVGLLGDFSLLNGTHGDADVTWTTFMGGLRVQADRESRGGSDPGPMVVVGLHALFGAVAESNGGGTDPAFAVGATLDVILNRQPNGSGVGIRAQADRVIRVGDSVDFTRVSLGIVYRFGQ